MADSDESRLRRPKDACSTGGSTGLKGILKKNKAIPIIKIK